MQNSISIVDVVVDFQEYLFITNFVIVIVIDATSVISYVIE